MVLRKRVENGELHQAITTHCSKHEGGGRMNENATNEVLTFLNTTNNKDMTKMELNVSHGKSKLRAAGS